ncbi:hypothetical protein yc1106_01402 [Curvularia clavata]|uniref:Uncharacterized protein n=1 Tax=Curvularia clavata TaxID=95742 RepID=A0A9Q8Z4D9_CURCL|nr:hypothetical protein yc1106_01402 [Curvularia clavata]
MAQQSPTILPIIDSKTATICTPSMSSDNTTKDFQQSEGFQSSVPWPGRTFIIRSQENGKVITFLDGEVILDKPGGLGTFRWRCVEKEGWLGFRDPSSARYLGYDKEGWLRCAVKWHQDWEYICARKRPDGGYIPLVLVEMQLLPLGVRIEETKDGAEDKVKIRNWDSEGIVWDFIEVPCPSK